MNGDDWVGIPAAANTGSSGSENQVRVFEPFSSSASANSVTGIRHRRSAKLKRHMKLSSLSTRVLLIGFGLSGCPDPGYPGLVIAGGKLRSMVWGFPLVLKGKMDLAGEVTHAAGGDAEQPRWLTMPEFIR